MIYLGTTVLVTDELGCNGAKTRSRVTTKVTSDPRDALPWSLYDCKLTAAMMLCSAHGTGGVRAWHKLSFHARCVSPNSPTHPKIFSGVCHAGIQASVRSCAFREPRASHSPLFCPVQCLPRCAHILITASFPCTLRSALVAAVAVHSPPFSCVALAPAAPCATCRLHHCTVQCCAHGQAPACRL